MQSVHLLLGSNLGDRVALLDRARALISARVGSIVRASVELSSEAWGYESDNLYLNQVIVVRTTLAPLDLLDTTQQIERELGRVPRRGDIYEDRPIDIDILYYGDLQHSSARLVIPHPEIENRPFVLALLGSMP